MVRNADLILIVLDIFNLSQLAVVKKELHKAGIRINKKHPDVKIRKTSKGGLTIATTVPLTKLTSETIKAIMAEYRIHNAEVLLRDDIVLEELIDVLAKNRVYKKAIVILNKTDSASSELILDAGKKLSEALFISADKGTNLDSLRESIFNALEFIHVFMKPQGREADLEEPLIIKKGSNVSDVCERLHKDFKNRFRFARIWGKSARYEGQRVGLEHRLEDGDIISLILER